MAYITYLANGTTVNSYVANDGYNDQIDYLKTVFDWTFPEYTLISDKFPISKTIQVFMELISVKPLVSTIRSYRKGYLMEGGWKHACMLKLSQSCRLEETWE